MLSFSSVVSKRMLSFIYFDVGGVAIKDFSGTTKWQELLKDLGVPLTKQSIIRKWWNQHIHPRVNLDLNLDDYLPHFEKLVNASLPANYSMVDDMIARFEPNHTLWPLISQLQQSHSLGLLTNMYPGMFNKISNAHLLPPVTWRTVVDSSIVMSQKPHPDIYHLAQQQAGIPHNQILFIDNVEENLDEPKRLGWQTYWYDSTNYEQSSQALKTYINSILTDRIV